MSNTVQKAAMDREKKKPRFKTTQSLIPATKLVGDGVILSDGQFVKSWGFENINFKSLGRAQEEQVLVRWQEALNSFEPGVSYKICILKKRLDMAIYKRDRLFQYKGDAQDKYREENNEMLLSKVRDTNLIEEKRYIQVSTKKKSLDEAQSFFGRIDSALNKAFENIGSECWEVPNADYLRDVWQFLHMDSEGFFDELEVPSPEKKHNLKNFLAPYQYEAKHTQNYLKIGGKYFRVLYIPPNGYGRYIRDTFLDVLTEQDISMAVSVDIIPLETSEAYKMIEDLEYKNEMNISNYKRNQAKIGNYDPDVPYSMRKKSEQIEEYHVDINERDQRLLMGHITILHVADDLEELDAQTEALKSAARGIGCELTELTLQQEDGVVTALPFGVNRFLDKKGSRLRTLTSEAMCSFIPFTVREFSHQNGIYYGVNALSKRPVFIDRKERMNGNMVVIGSSGSGKTFKVMEELNHVILNSDDKVIIIDPEREYADYVNALGGTVIRIASDSTDYINALELSDTYNDGKTPVPLKSEAILNFYTLASGANDINSRAKSLIDRCVSNVYGPYIASGYTTLPPTLVDLSNEILNQKDEIAKDIALTLQLYTTGSLNIFARQTNVDMNSRIICFDISDLGDAFTPIAMLIITDHISNLLSMNRKLALPTWVVIDEIHMMFKQEFTARFFQDLWKRIRKYGGFPTGITQEFEDLANSETARSLVNNSDFSIILSINDRDAETVQAILGLDDEQMEMVRNVGPKKGMFKLGNSYIPFEDNFPENTELFRLMNTDTTKKRVSASGISTTSEVSTT